MMLSLGQMIGTAGSIGVVRSDRRPDVQRDVEVHALMHLSLDMEFSSPA